MKGSVFINATNTRGEFVRETTNLPSIQGRERTTRQRKRFRRSELHLNKKRGGNDHSLHAEPFQREMRPLKNPIQQSRREGKEGGRGRERRKRREANGPYELRAPETRETAIRGNYITL